MPAPWPLAGRASDEFSIAGAYSELGTRHANIFSTTKPSAMAEIH